MSTQNVPYSEPHSVSYVAWNFEYVGRAMKRRLPTLGISSDETDRIPYLVCKCDESGTRKVYTLVTAGPRPDLEEALFKDLSAEKL